MTLTKPKCICLEQKCIFTLKVSLLKIPWVDPVEPHIQAKFPAESFTLCPGRSSGFCIRITTTELLYTQSALFHYCINAWLTLNHVLHASRFYVSIGIYLPLVSWCSGQPCQRPNSFVIAFSVSWQSTFKEVGVFLFLTFWFLAWNNSKNKKNNSKNIINVCWMNK